MTLTGRAWASYTWNPAVRDTRPLLELFLLPGETWRMFATPRASDGRLWSDVAGGPPVGVRPGKDGAASSFLRESEIPCSRCGRRLASGRNHVRIKDGESSEWICRACAMKDRDLVVIARTLHVPGRRVRMGGCPKRVRSRRAPT